MAAEADDAQARARKRENCDRGVVTEYYDGREVNESGGAVWRVPRGRQGVEDEPS
jgi:hypothetical protein